MPAPLPRSGTELTRAAVSPRLNNATAGASTSGYFSTRSPGELTSDVLGTFYSRRNLTPRCLALHVLACDFLAASFRRRWYSTSAKARSRFNSGSPNAASSSRTVRSKVSSGVFSEPLPR